MIVVSIVIVNWNAYRYVEQCLRSIAETMPDGSYEVIVVDNASTDKSVSLLKERFPWVCVIENNNNAGFARANNQGFTRSKGNYVLILNPDTIVLPAALEGLTDFLDRNSVFAAVGPKLLNENKTIQFECARNFPTLLTEFFWLSTLVRRFPKNKIIGRYLMSYWNHESAREVDCLSGACIMIRREVLERVNFFDEDFFMYGEDVDLCYRIRKSGGRIYYLPEAEIIHYGGVSSKQISTRAAVYDREAIYTFFKKNYGIFSAVIYKMMCFFIGGGMTLICGIIAGVGFKNISLREKARKVSAENTAILQWSIGIYGK